MGVNPSMLRVFVSSTSEDLKAHRAVAQQVIIKMGWYPVMMEFFGAMPSPTVQACQEKLKECQLMLLLVAWRRGFVPSTEQGGNGTDSITALELAYARAQNIPVLALMADRSWPIDLVETDDPVALAWIKKFRDGLNLPVEWFPQEDPQAADERRLPVFRDQAYKVLLAYKERLVAEASSVDSASRVDFFASARRGLTDHKSIPFIGPGVFGDGPLGVSGLVKAMRARALETRTRTDGSPLDEQDPCLATAAEYCERYLGGRSTFLELLGKVISEQSRQSPMPTSFELLARSECRPEVVIAATHDQLLEDCLAKSSRPFVVISHIIRSYEGDNDGRVVLIRPNEAPLIRTADKVGGDLRPGELVIYRLLGSPLVHDRLDPDLELDTVVVTEADHVAFLGRLGDPQTGVPSWICRKLQRGALLFLGYGLNLWQYRLVMQLFRAVGGEAGRSMVAVRRPSSDMEELSWKRLGADLVQLDSNEFAQRVISTFAAA